MKYVLLLWLTLSFFFSYSIALKASQERSAKPLALVYNGVGACKPDCAKAVADVLRAKDFYVRYVNEKNFNEELLSKAFLYVQPGGNAIEVAQSLSFHQKNLLRYYISNGLNYLGFCAGAFFIDHFVDDKNSVLGLGLLNGQTLDLYKDSKARILRLTWENKERYLYFQEGPYFLLNSNSKVEVLAWYNSRNLTPAVIKFYYGQGLVIASGVHPEAPLTWRTQNPGHPLYDPDGLDFDLAYSLINDFLIKK
jgi:glutamine amidotransferase-like uncharacterized protein